MDREFHGNQRSKLLHYFVTDWLGKGPPVAILQGFPGCGKTQLARDVAEKSGLPPLMLFPLSEAPDPTVDLLTDLPDQMKAAGIHDLMQEMDKGAHGDLFKALSS